MRRFPRLLLAILLSSFIGSAKSIAASNQFDFDSWRSAGFKNVTMMTLNGDQLAEGLPQKSTHSFDLVAVVFRGNRWTPQLVKQYLGKAARTFNQCGVAIGSVQIIIADELAPYAGKADREEDELLARLTPVKHRPLVYFSSFISEDSIADEIGYAYNKFTNVSSASPAMHTAWLTDEVESYYSNKGYDPSYDVLAHELGHVLADWGHHTGESKNLMSSHKVTMANYLSKAQCDDLRASPMVKPIH